MAAFSPSKSNLTDCTEFGPRNIQMALLGGEIDEERHAETGKQIIAIVHPTQCLKRLKIRAFPSAFLFGFRYHFV